MLSTEYIQSQTKLPSYLKQFYIDNTDIILIVGKGTSNDSPINNSIQTDSVQHIKEEDTDLIGNPLKVDLGCDETFEIRQKDKLYDNWSLEESKHVPIDTRAARRAINRLINEQSLPVYAVCNGDKTVVLGAQKLYNEKTCLVQILGCFANGHEYTTLQYMEREHKKRCRTDKVDVLIRKKFFLDGYDLSKIDLRECELNGSVGIEAIWNTWHYGGPQDAFMTIQTIIGHRLSLIDLQWQDLNLLQTFLTILADLKRSNCETTKICQNETDLLNDDDFENMISCLNQFFVSKLHSQETNKTSDVYAKNLRPETIMDKLWMLLKNCENLSNLRDYLTYFFESLAEIEKKIHNLSENVSTIGTIIKGILDGKIAVPTINFTKALELLFELGVEKLKNDYLTILNKINHSVHKHIEKNWSELHDRKELPHQKMRKTSIILKLPAANLQENQKKLDYLKQLHTAAELLLFVEKNYTLNTNQDCFREAIFNNFIMHFKNMEYINERLYEFSFKLNNTNLEMIKERTPTMSTVKMYSNFNDLEITTIFHLSEYKIFPPNIYNNYDDLETSQCHIQKSEQKSQPKYYITKFQSFVDSSFVHS